MVTEMITLKMEDNFLADIDVIVKKEGYQSRTEFIRGAIREKLKEIKLQGELIELWRLKGASGKKTTDKEIHRIRQQVFEEFERKD